MMFTRDIIRNIGASVLAAVCASGIVLFAGRSYEGRFTLFVIVSAFMSGVAVFLLISGMGILRQARARRHTAELISAALRGDARAATITDPQIATCWQERDCYFQQCAVYGREHVRCWLVDGTFCRGEEEGTFPGKLEYCFKCEIFRKAVDDDPVREMEERFRGLLYLLEDRENKLAELYSGSETKRRMLELLLRLSRDAMSSLELDTLLELVVRQLIGRIAEFAAIFVTDAEGELELRASEGLEEGVFPRLELKDGQDFVSRTMEGDRLIVGSDLADEPWLRAQFAQQEMPATVMGVPLISRGQKYGVLLAGIFRDEPYSAIDMQVVQVAADQIALAVSNASLYESARELAATDGLTGLPNHRSFFEVLDKELGRSRRYDRPLSLVMLDIDHFKKYNDAYGHPQGDKLLSEIAKVLKDSVRIADTPARYGGEEFAVILPETQHGASRDIAGSAMQVAERIRRAVEEYTFEGRPGKRDIKMSVSIGVAEHPAHAIGLTELVSAADAALYRAKRGGRNRVELAEEAQERYGVTTVDDLTGRSG